MKTLKSIWIICMSGILVLSSCDNSKTEKQSKENLTESTDSNHEAKAGDGRYGIKSGKIISETMLPNGMGKTTVMQIFDDYGNLEKTTTTSEITAYGVNNTKINYGIMRDHAMYSWADGETTGSRMSLEGKMDVSKLNYNKLSDDLKKQFNIKEEGKENILGKNCDVYALDYMGAKGKVYIWKGITMKSDMAMAGMNVTIQVISIDENAAISSDQFALPADVTFTEIKMPVGKQ